MKTVTVSPGLLDTWSLESLQNQTKSVLSAGGANLTSVSDAQCKKSKSLDNENISAMFHDCIPTVGAVVVSIWL